MRWIALCLALILMPGVAPAQPSMMGALSPEARADIAKATALQDRADWAAAVPLMERALADALVSPGIAHGATVELATVYGILLANAGRDEEALEHFERLFAEVKKHFLPYSPFYTSVEIKYATYLAAAGRTAEALPLALGVTRRVGDMVGADTATAALYLRDAAGVLRRMGYRTESNEAYVRIVTILDRDGSAEAARQAAGVVFLIGDNHDRMGNVAQALAAYVDADARYTASFGPRHPETLSVRIARARSAFDIDDRPQVARLVADNLPVAAEVFGTDSIEYASWLRMQARAVQIAPGGGPEAAIPIMARAVDITAARLPATHRVLAETRRDYAGLLSIVGRYEDAWTQYTASQGALPPDRKFMLDLMEFRREQGGLTETSFAVEVLPHLQRTGYGAARGAVREQVLRRLIRDPGVADLYRRTTDLVEERRRLEEEVAELASRALADADPAREVAVQVRLSALADTIRAQMAEVHAREPAFAELSGAVDPDLAALQALLAPDEAVVLIDHQRHDQEWSVAVAITRDATMARVFWVPVGDLNGWVSSIRDSIRLTLGVRAAVALDAPQPEAAEFDFVASYELFHASLGKVTDLILDKRHLMIEFRGPMTGIPPGLLIPIEPGPDTTVENAPWLIQFHAMSILPTITSLRTAALAAEAPRAPQGFLGFADPVFDAAAAEALLVASADTGDTRLRGALVPLPETADEARAVRQSVAGGQGGLWLGAEATEARVKAEPLDQARMLYFATHGLVSGDRAGGTLLTEPALALTPGQGEDGFLTATEIAGLRLNADWVVLSACNTAQGDAPGAEALSGLAQAFLYAGARSLLVSHWPVESRSAVKLMTDTFRFATDGQGRRAAEAQQQAMIDMIGAPDRPEWSHPAYWAPFVLVGSPD
jgi:tetratricopeptide (TPR) repeat protein